MEAKKLTDNCHMITDLYNNKLGLTFAVEDKVLFTHDLEVYSSIEEIAQKFNETVLYTELTSTEISKLDIDGYPIRHEVCFDVKHEDDRISYKSRENSNIEFYAGWWIVSTESQIRLVLSPKSSTITDTSMGPYKNKFDCQTEMNRLKHELS